jgi:hypothetical protein
MIYGHMYFEQVGEIVDGRWRLRKLAVRVPQSISDIKVASDGGLVSIQQNVHVPQSTSFAPWGQPEIPVDRLTGFIFEQEGANWVGRSILRDCYRNWLVKDRLVRVDAINHEKAGGIPIGTAAPESTPGEIASLSQMMQAMRVGETSGGATPAGTEVTVMRATGASHVSDSIRMHDEAMARRFLLMLANLAQGGQHVGSYALGAVFQDFFILGQKAICDWYIDVMNEHVIEDWIDWNFANEDLVPILAYEGDDEVLGIDQLATLVKNNIVIVDEEVEDSIRYKYHLPKRTAPRPEPQLAIAAPDGGDADGGAGAPSPSPSAQSQNGTANNNDAVQSGGGD